MHGMDHHYFVYHLWAQVCHAVEGKHILDVV